MSMTSAAIKTSVFCDLETSLCPRTVLVKERMNGHTFSSEVQARGRSRTRQALTTVAVEESLGLQADTHACTGPAFCPLLGMVAYHTLHGSSCGHGRSPLL